METLRDYVNWGIAHSDKVVDSEGVPLVMERCKRNKKMKQLEVYGESMQDGTPSPETPVEIESVGELVTDTTHANYGKYKIPVTVKGKNLFKPTGVSGDGIGGDGKLALKGSYGTTIDSTDFSDNKVVVTQVPNEAYGVEAYQNGYICFLIPELTIGKKYILSFDMSITNNPLNANYLVCYACTYSIPRVVLSSGTRYKITFQYKTPSGGKPPYVEVRCGGASFELSNVMITEEGQEHTFEPYIEPVVTNIYLNEPLRKIGDYVDYIDFKGKKVVRNTFMRVYDGRVDTNNPFNKLDNEENWGDGLSNENFWQYTLNDVLPIIPKADYTDYKQMPICLQLPVKTGYFNSSSVPASVDKELIWYSDLGRGVRLFLSKSRAELGDGSISALKAYLKDNPISVLIATYEPYEEPIDCDLPILAEKTTVIDIGTTVKPSNIKGKYIKR